MFLLLNTGHWPLNAAAVAAADWPMAGANPQRTNYTPDSPAPAEKIRQGQDGKEINVSYYPLVWAADFSPEMMYSAQPVIAAGRLFQTTLQGNVYALDTATGERLWHFKAGPCVWNSAAAGTPEYGGEGLVFVASWDGFIYALDAATGKEIWRFDADEPVSGSPCISENTVFIGTRKGTMLALDAATGALKWSTPVSWHVYSSPSYHEGRVFVASEDIRVHCLDAKTGALVWQSEKLNGMLIREFYPVIHKGKVMLSVTPLAWKLEPGEPEPFWMFWVAGSQEKMDAILDKYTEVFGSPEQRYYNYRRSALTGKPMPPELAAAQEQLVEYYRNEPEQQGMFVLNESDGKQAYFAVHHYAGAGLEGVNRPPVVCADGLVLNQCVFNGSRPAFFDVDANRWVDFLFTVPGSPSDNAEYVSVAGKRAVVKKWFGAITLVVDLETRRCSSLSTMYPWDYPHLYPPDEQLAGPVMVSVLENEWLPDAHGPLTAGRLGGTSSRDWGLKGLSPVPVAGNMIFLQLDNSVIRAYRGASQ